MQLVEIMKGSAVGEALLTPTKIYVRQILSLMGKVDIKAVSHITGGGFYENIPRMLGDNTRALIERESLVIPPIFNLIAKAGKIEERDMFNTFNMGTGMVVALAKEDADRAVSLLSESGAEARVIGEIAAGEPGVEMK
jgi:phosphoribosylformylglycinamidine cyclo-ligase